MARTETSISVLPLIDVAEGKMFRPFEGVQLAIPESARVDEVFRRIAEVPINVEGINGKLYLEAILDPSEYAEPFLTPFGPAPYYKEYDNKKERVFKAPLGLGVEFFPTTSEQAAYVYGSELQLFQPGEVGGYKINWRSGGNTLHLETQARGKKPGKLWGEWTRIPGKTGFPVLPFDAERLSQIEARIVKSPTRQRSRNS